MKDDLLKHGYYEYKPSPFDSDCVKKCYQKSFKDKNGNRKYFLTWKEWDFSQYADYHHPELEYQHSFEGNTQLITTDDDAIEITFFNGWSRDRAEKFLKKLFDTGWFEKYDNDYPEIDDDGMTRTWVIKEDGSVNWE